MLVEVSPNWDGRDKRVTYMEAFGRLMAGIAPWLALPDDGTPEGAKRKELRELALKAYANAVDPDSPDYLLWRKEGQPMVDAAYIAESFLRAWDALWVPLDQKTKDRYIEEFTQIRRIDPLHQLAPFLLYDRKSAMQGWSALRHIPYKLCCTQDGGMVRWRRLVFRRPVVCFRLLQQLCVPSHVS